MIENILGVAIYVAIGVLALSYTAIACYKKGYRACRNDVYNGEAEFESFVDHAFECGYETGMMETLARCDEERACAKKCGEKSMASDSKKITVKKVKKAK